MEKTEQTETVQGGGIASLVRKAAGNAQPKEEAKAAVLPANQADENYAYPPLSLFQKAKPADEGH